MRRSSEFCRNALGAAKIDMEGVFIAMGFPMDRVRIAIAECGDDQDATIQYLLDHAREPSPGAPPTSDNAILVGELISMGFTRERVLKAVEACGPKVEECTQWLIDGAPAEPHEAAADVGSGSAVETELRNMGFQADRVHLAVRQKGEDLEAALQWLVAEQETLLMRVEALHDRLRVLESAFDCFRLG